MFVDDKSNIFDIQNVRSELLMLSWKHQWVVWSATIKKLRAGVRSRTCRRQ